MRAFFFSTLCPRQMPRGDVSGQLCETCGFCLQFRLRCLTCNTSGMCKTCARWDGIPLTTWQFKELEGQLFVCKDWGIVQRQVLVPTKQSMTVPKILNDTGTDTFFRYQIFAIPIPVLFSGTKFFRYRFRDFFPIPNFTDTGSETFFRYQFFPIPVPIPPEKLTIPLTISGTYTAHIINL